MNRANFFFYILLIVILFSPLFGLNDFDNKNIVDELSATSYTQNPTPTTTKLFAITIPNQIMALTTETLQGTICQTNEIGDGASVNSWCGNILNNPDHSQTKIAVNPSPNITPTELSIYRPDLNISFTANLYHSKPPLSEQAIFSVVNLYSRFQQKNSTVNMIYQGSVANLLSLDSQARHLSSTQLKC